MGKGAGSASHGARRTASGGSGAKGGGSTSHGGRSSSSGGSSAKGGGSASHGDRSSGSGDSSAKGPSSQTFARSAASKAALPAANLIYYSGHTTKGSSAAIAVKSTSGSGAGKITGAATAQKTTSGSGAGKSTGSATAQKTSVPHHGPTSQHASKPGWDLIKTTKTSNL